MQHGMATDIVGHVGLGAIAQSRLQRRRSPCNFFLTVTMCTLKVWIDYDYKSDRGRTISRCRPKLLIQRTCCGAWFASRATTFPNRTRLDQI